MGRVWVGNCLEIGYECGYRLLRPVPDYPSNLLVKGNKNMLKTLKSNRNARHEALIPWCFEMKNNISSTILTFVSLIRHKLY